MTRPVLTVGGARPPSQPRTGSRTVHGSTRGVPDWPDMTGDERRRRLAAARLYLVCDARPESFLDAALDGGVDLVQLRAKDASDEEVLRAAEAFRRACARHGALFLVNDR